jgi:hypothetical protein
MTHLFRTMAFFLIVIGQATFAEAQWDGFQAAKGHSVLRMQDTEQDTTLFIACRAGGDPDLAIRLEVPFSATIFPEELWPKLVEQQTSVFMLFADLSSPAGMPVQVFERSLIFSKDTNHFLLGVGVPPGDLGLAPDDAALALRHVMSGRAKLSIAFGQSIKNPAPFYRRSFDLSDIGKLAEEWLGQGCAGIETWRGARERPEGVTRSTRSVEWWFYENTRHSAAQRQALEIRARSVLGENTQSVSCAYSEDGGERRYEFWDETAPSGLSEVIRLSGRNDTRGAKLGSYGVVHCPPSEDAARLLWHMTRNGSWPVR